MLLSGGNFLWSLKVSLDWNFMPQSPKSKISVFAQPKKIKLLFRQKTNYETIFQMGYKNKIKEASIIVLGPNAIGFSRV